MCCGFLTKLLGYLQAQPDAFLVNRLTDLLRESDMLWCIKGSIALVAYKINFVDILVGKFMLLKLLQFFQPQCKDTFRIEVLDRNLMLFHILVD